MSFANLDRLQRLEQNLHEAIRGQDHVIPAVVERVTIGESGLATAGRPKGSFLFIGPTGVGKTELARVLAQSLYGDEEPERFDMAEFSAHDAVKNFIGDQSGSLGRLGQVLARLNRGVLLFDEIEKAHLEVIALFLSILDAGRITCGTGRTFDLSDFYIIFTSNLGALDILRAKHLNFTQIERHILAQVATVFRPEFLGRIDSKLVFRKLAYEVQLEIAYMHLDREQTFLAGRGHKISFDGDVLTFLLQVGFDKYLGARPLRKAMEKHIRYPLARHLMTHGNEALSGTLKVHAAKIGLIFST
jgi:ATP-dependent Clp protease ATP-binding subunit ClpB